MKHLTRFLTIAAMLLTINGLFSARSVFYSASAQDIDEELKKLYTDPELFECLSSAAQNLLQNIFGGQTPPGEQNSPSAGGQALSAVDLDPSQVNYDRLEQALPAGEGGYRILMALGNPIVNDPSVDLTARDTQSETTLVLGGGSNVIAAFNDSGSLVPPSTAMGKFTGFSRSLNMGATWIDGGTLPTNPNGDAGDPVLARDNTLGRTYFSTLAFSGPGLQVFRSNDDAATWQTPVNGAPGIPSGFQDKEWIAVDNFPGAGQGNVYLAWRSFSTAFAGIRFTRSTDGGATFGPSGGVLIKAAVPSNVQGAYVTVGPDHSVYVFWYDQNFLPRQIRMRKSTDQGLTFGPEISVTTLLSTLTNGSLGAVGGFRTNSFPQAAVNPLNASNLYVVYNDNPTGVDSGDVYFRQSTDGGLTWGAAGQLNTDGTTRLQWSPALAVKPNGSGLAVTWYDRRRDLADSLIETWGTLAAISGTTVTFGPNFRISGQFPPVFGQDPVINSVYMGDYDTTVADNDFFYTTWGDNRLPNPNFPAHKNQPDVRFAKIPMAGPGPIVDFGSSTISGGDLDGIIEPDECNTLNVAIQNNGTATATGIVGVLSTSTPGVTIVQPISDYPNLSPGASGLNTTPYKISTSPGFVCGTTINLTLTLTYAGGSDTSTFALPTCECPPTTITGSLAAGDPTQTGRLFRDGVPSTCGSTKACSILNAATQFRYDSYTITNGGAPACVRVDVSTACTGANFIFGAAYLGSFNPASICTNRIADTGSSPFPNATMSFNLAANETVVLVISEVTANAGCPNYNITVSGLICGTAGNGACPLGCTTTQGFWRTHPEAWPVISLTLGTVTYSQAQLLSILNQPPRGNGLLFLAYQLIGARLNLASGAAATPEVVTAIANSNALIDGLVIPPIGSGYLLPSATTALTNILDSYNKGLSSGAPLPCP